MSFLLSFLFFNYKVDNCYCSDKILKEDCVKILAVGSDQYKYKHINSEYTHQVRKRVIEVLYPYERKCESL